MIQALGVDRANPWADERAIIATYCAQTRWSN